MSVGVASPVFAQSTRRPDLNLFGRGLRDPQQQLSVQANLGATFYDTISGQIAPLEGPAPPDHGWGSFASAGLTYAVRLGNFNLDGSIRSIASYYPALAKPFRAKTLPGADAGFGWGYSWELSPRTQVRVGSRAGYRALSQEATGIGGILAGGNALGGPRDIVTDPTLAFLPGNGNVASLGGGYLEAGANASLQHQFSRRWSASSDYGVRRYHAFSMNDNLFGTWSQNAGARLHFAVTRNLSVRGGYRYDENHARNEARAFRSHGADVGVDYGQGGVLQLARHTTLSFAGGVGGYVDRSNQQRYPSQR